ncbi:hypothetical protein ACTQ5K_13270 [Niallia sp. Sow4_A1]|uniref:DUF1616 domain-containing protein n=1 Tax=Niallia hominis TaxID=3133173 RepID=A0ABV1EWN9_9BACI|nr:MULTISPECIES: hypothetical protein [Bacillaceae]MCF2648402.1 hypothetical protein [Niallia circulans]MCM3361504.1 hypothetical protein [Niallia sp. MER TA 168]CAI9387262.1 hypothetical protein BACSP_01945 [Bacillus sp. T2.9-1]
MRKISGIVMIIISLVLAFASALSFKDDFIFANILLWVISFPLYISGQLIRTSKYEFKQRGKRWVSIYLFFFLILPLLMFLFESYQDLKETTFVDEQFITYEPASGDLGVIALVGFMILLSLFAGRFLNPGLKRKGLLNSIIIGTIVFLIGFHYFMFTDYRGIHEEKGLISSNWKGEKDIIGFEEIESVFVEPYVHYANLNIPSDDTKFSWKVIFQPNNQKEKVIYHYTLVTKSGLEEMVKIKTISQENNIPFNVGEMDQETRKWFDLDLEVEELEEERYYELFEVNNR